jgi:hypothetical protein
MSERAKKPFKFSGRRDYFAVNCKPSGLTTSFRVSGRLGELGRRHCLFNDAQDDVRRINRAYNLGFRHGQERG